MRDELGDHDGEVGLGRSDEDVEVEEHEKPKKRDGEKWVLAEEAGMEGEVVEESIGFITEESAGGIEEGPVRKE